MAGNGFVVRVPKIAAQSKDSQLYESLRDIISKTNDQLTGVAAATDLLALAQLVDGLTAADIAFVPVGGIAAVDVQAALAELDTDKANTSHTQAVTTLTFSATDRLAGRASAGAGAGEEITCTAAGRAILDDADAATQRTTLGAAAASHTHVIGDLTGFASNTYTPTLTGVLNVTSTSAASGFYLRVGNVVHVAGSFGMDPVAGSTLTKVGISLPIASAFTAIGDCSGQASRDSGGATMNFGRIIADATNDRAEWQATIDADANDRVTFFSFTYLIK